MGKLDEFSGNKKGSKRCLFYFAGDGFPTPSCIKPFS
jgi:hypothetical protein